MKKTLLIFSVALLLVAFKITPSGFPDLRPDGNPANSYAVQAGNIVSCYTKAILDASPISGNSSFKVGFYLSADSSISTNDILIGTYSVAAISIGSPVTCSVVNINLATKSVPTGTYYIGTYVDYQNQVSENGTTPEIANNNWSFKSAAGVYKVIHYPGLDVGIAENNVAKDIEKHVSANGDLVIRSKRAEDITVEVYSIDGKLIHKEKGHEVILQNRKQEMVLLKITTASGSASEKIVL